MASNYVARSAFSVSNTELSIVNGNSTPAADTTTGTFVLMIDGANMQKGDEFLVKIKEKVVSGGTQRILQQFRLKGAQSELAESLPHVLVVGWDMTIQRISATDRDFDVAIRKV